MSELLLEVKNLKTSFLTDEGTVRAVDGVDLTIHAGEAVGLVGESGCGKSVTSLSIMGLIPTPPGVVTADSLRWRGRDLLGLTPAEMNKLRGNELAMVFQEPMTSLNPVYTIGDQIGEVLRVHQGLSKDEARQLAVGLLAQVGIPAPEKTVAAFPHQLSGGMRQRVMIAMAIACRPALLIADEPTTALDVTIQAQILDLLRELRQQTAMAVLLITHDLGIVAELAERVVVMYAGVVVENAPAAQLFKEPLHPYTQGLLAAVPRLDQTAERLHVIPGVVPSPGNMPAGCRFAPRCPLVMPACRRQEPALLSQGVRQVRCLLYEGGC
ncbi:MAG TPA: ABC transporter ATP-binding protein [Firmicutes bacterium]|nr:ABC transporter ATP-binding protein [Bacillota bacterium]HOQ25083.1 ABC transporter ATP-binding protein [Bacillota bacterium]HPT68445.1 ABC transporter ATP-binding protein [Bacillota bacterium]